MHGLPHWPCIRNTLAQTGTGSDACSVCACVGVCAAARSYGRGRERGAARPEVLQSLLATTDRVVQEVDSVEYGLTDIQVRMHAHMCAGGGMGELKAPLTDIQVRMRTHVWGWGLWGN